MGLDEDTISGAIKILQEKVKEKTDKMRDIVKKRAKIFV